MISNFFLVPLMTSMLLGVSAQAFIDNIDGKPYFRDSLKYDPDSETRNKLRRTVVYSMEEVPQTLACEKGTPSIKYRGQQSIYIHRDLGDVYESCQIVLEKSFLITDTACYSRGGSGPGIWSNDFRFVYNEPINSLVNIYRGEDLIWSTSTYKIARNKLKEFIRDGKCHSSELRVGEPWIPSSKPTDSLLVPSNSTR